MCYSYCGLGRTEHAFYAGADRLNTPLHGAHAKQMSGCRGCGAIKANASSVARLALDTHVQNPSRKAPRKSEIVIYAQIRERECAT